MEHNILHVISTQLVAPNYAHGSALATGTYELETVFGVGKDCKNIELRLSVSVLSSLSLLVKVVVVVV